MNFKYLIERFKASFVITLIVILVYSLYQFTKGF